MRNEYSIQIMGRSKVNELRESAARERLLRTAKTRQPGICCQALIAAGKALKAILERKAALNA